MYSTEGFDVIISLWKKSVGAEAWRVSFLLDDKSPSWHQCTVDSSVILPYLGLILDNGSDAKGRPWPAGCPYGRGRTLWEGRAIVVISKWMTTKILHYMIVWGFSSTQLLHPNQSKQCLVKNSAWPLLRPQHSSIMCLHWLQSEHIFCSDSTEITHRWQTHFGNELQPSSFAISVFGFDLIWDKDMKISHTGRVTWLFTTIQQHAKDSGKGCLNVWPQDMRPGKTKWDASTGKK